MTRTIRTMDPRPVKHVRSAPAKARGAALTETVVSTIILVPLLFGTAMLGKIIDTRQTAVQASRYAVWESTVHGSDAPPDDVHDRFFARHDLAGSVDGSAADASARTNPGSSTVDDGRPLGDMRRKTRVRIGSAGVSALAYDERFENRDGTSVATAVGKAVHGAGNLLRGASGGEWDVTANGFVRGRVAVPVEGNGWLAGATLVEPSVIMNDGWSASGTAQLEKRTKSFVPAGALESVADILSAVSVVPVLRELGGLEGALGKVDASVLPTTERHELQPYPEATR